MAELLGRRWHCWNPMSLSARSPWRKRVLPSAVFCVWKLKQEFSTVLERPSITSNTSHDHLLIFWMHRGLWKVRPETSQLGLTTRWNCERRQRGRQRLSFMTHVKWSAGRHGSYMHTACLFSFGNGSQDTGTSNPSTRRVWSDPLRKQTCVSVSSVPKVSARLVKRATRLKCNIFRQFLWTF